MTRLMPLLVLLTLGCLGHPDSGEQPFEAQNLLLLSVDTYRRDYLERYGATTGLTPFVDELAARSLVLDRHSSCSNWTLGGVLCANNGRYSADFDFVARLPVAHREVVPERASLASWLRDEGFVTILLTSNGWLEGDWHHDAGYTYAEHPRTDVGTSIWEQGRNKLLEQINQGAERWFLHVHLKEPHSPYKPPDEYLEALEDLEPIDYDLSTTDGHDDARYSLGSMSEEERALVMEHLRIRYDGEMAYLDDTLAGIWADASNRGLLENTLVAFWSDHGEQFYERERWGHAYDLYEEETGALAFFWHHGIEPQAISEPTHHIDIAPTALRWLELDLPDEITGEPVLEAEPDRVFFGTTVGRAGPQLTASQGDLRMHYDFDGGDLLAYDLGVDPDAATDIYDPFDPEQTALWGALDAYATELEPLLEEYRRVEPDR